MQRLISSAVCALIAVATPAPTFAQKAPAAPASTTLNRIKQTSKIRLGYQPDARPFSFRDGSGQPTGYSVALCLKVVDAVKAELGMPNLNVEWTATSAEDRFSAIADTKVDLFCGADTETLARRQTVGFSLAVFPGGIGALVRTDAPTRLTEILNQKPPSSPAWRASAGQLLTTQTFAVIKGTTAESWLGGKLNEFKLTSKVAPVSNYDAGIKAVLERKANVFFADRAVLLDLIAHNPSGKQLTVLDRTFTYEPFALPLPRGDDVFRNLVDRTLSRLYPTPEFSALYVDWFGKPSPDVVTFYRWNTRPE